MKERKKKTTEEFIRGEGSETTERGGSSSQKAEGQSTRREKKRGRNLNDEGHSHPLPRRHAKLSVLCPKRIQI